MEENKKGKRTILNKFEGMKGQLGKALQALSTLEGPEAAEALQNLTKCAGSLDQLQEDVETDHSQLTALMGVGYVINSSRSLKQVLEEVMDSLIKLKRAERGFLMLREEDGELSIKTARGMDRSDLQGEEFAVSRTIVQRVMELCEPVLTTNAQEDPRFQKQSSVVAHRLRSILCVPLQLKDELIGVIYVDNRVYTGHFQLSDLDLISAFANQAAVAINNARLFDDLHVAYDATLRGWVKALDIRDKETEGHTQRVTALTRALAKVMGVEGEDLDHLTRGALLHDIGKLAIPDGILLKPSDLTPAERSLMELHPVFAREMLEPIKSLHPAIDIPHCHHEKWNGSGYPRGLKGEEIPFPARIFAVADVWDALTSKRPYREPIDPKVARRHIQDESGRHFDPRIVKTFLSLKNLPVALPDEVVAGALTDS